MYEKSVELLNKAVGDELSAVHQFGGLVTDEERHFARLGEESEHVERHGQSDLARQAMERSTAAGGPAGGEGCSK
jgi:hypothetical protein